MANDEKSIANVIFAMLCSALGYWWWVTASDGFNLIKWLLDRFPLYQQMASHLATAGPRAMKNVSPDEFGNMVDPMWGRPPVERDYRCVITADGWLFRFSPCLEWPTEIDRAPQRQIRPAFTAESHCKRSSAMACDQSSHRPAFRGIVRGIIVFY